MNAAAPTRLVEALDPDARTSVETIVPLSDLRPGQAGTIESIAPRFSASRRLLALGFVPGSEVQVRRVAPLRDPVEYCVRGTCISLRRQEASWIFVRTAVK